MCESLFPTHWVHIPSTVSKKVQKGSHSFNFSRLITGSTCKIINSHLKEEFRPKLRKPSKTKNNFVSFFYHYFRQTARTRRTNGLLHSLEKVSHAQLWSTRPRNTKDAWKLRRKAIRRLLQVRIPQFRFNCLQPFESIHFVFQGWKISDDDVCSKFNRHWFDVVTKLLPVQKTFLDGETPLTFTKIWFHFSW